MKNSVKYLIACIALAALCACQESPDATDASWSETPLTVRVDNYRLELKTNTMRAGTCFYDSCGIEIYSGGEPVESEPTIAISSSGTTYGPEDPLPAGTYAFDISCPSLSGCKFNGELYVMASAPIEASEGNGYHTISKEDAEKYRVGNYDNHGGLGVGKTNSIGKPNLLVIPLAFSDTEFTENELAKLEKAYFGEAEDTGWESLKSYYKKSSYGALEFEGTVVDPYEYPMTSMEVETAYLNGKLTVGDIVETVFADIVERDNINLNDYDVDKDGYLDGIEVIYKSSRTYTLQTSGLWWCFTTTYQAEPGVDEPTLNRYFWSLYSMIDNGYYGDATDCHTLIHETGHMLGLNDYYDYTKSSFPMGGVDMMDLNVGDHSAYSKYLLGWVTPKVIDGTSKDFTITLSSFTETGDCLLLRDTDEDPHNGTPYDEYLMLSYSTPTGLNEKDSNGYPEWDNSIYGHGGTYAKAGLQVTHIDDRMISFAESTLDSNGELDISTAVAAYADTPSNTAKTEDGTLVESPTYTLTSNTPYYSYCVTSLGGLMNESSFRECAVIPASGTTASADGDYSAFGAQTTLFGLPEYGCGSTYYSNRQYSALFPKGEYFNDGSQNQYVFYVTDQADDTITLHFIKTSA